MVARDGRVRDAWAGVATALDEMGVTELRQRHRERGPAAAQRRRHLQRLRRRRHLRRPWSLDPVPLLIGSGEWAAIEHAVTQRAELLDLLLADLYGPRSSAARASSRWRWWPAHPRLPALVRPGRGCRASGSCCRTRPTWPATPAGGPGAEPTSRRPRRGGLRAREPHGDRRGCSRASTARLQVHRLAPFFRSMRAALNAAGPAGIDDPRVVVLTPGPFNETYFEHAYLATLPGLPAGRGRRPHGAGGAGLAQVAGRPGTGRRARAPRRRLVLRPARAQVRLAARRARPGRGGAPWRGVGGQRLRGRVLENPGLLPFLPGVAEHLLGQPLELPSVTTWWCGTPPSAPRARAPRRAGGAGPSGSARPAPTSMAGTSTRPGATRCGGASRPSPWRSWPRRRWPSRRSRAWRATGSRAGPWCCARSRWRRDGSYNVMPGGLARVASLPEERGWSAPAGGLSKDTWVLASEPEPQSGLLAQPRPGPGGARPGEGDARPCRREPLLAGPLRRARRGHGAPGARHPRPPQRLRQRRSTSRAPSACSGSSWPSPGSAAPPTSRPRSATSSTDGCSRWSSDPGRTGSLAYTLQALLSAIQGVRDQMSADTWLVVADLERQLEALDTRRVDPYATLPRGARRS